MTLPNVIANPGCQLDRIENQLKGELRGTAMREFLNQIILRGNTCPNYECHLLVAASVGGSPAKRTARKTALLLACMPSLSL